MHRHSHMGSFDSISNPMSELMVLSIKSHHEGISMIKPAEETSARKDLRSRKKVASSVELRSGHEIIFKKVNSLEVFLEDNSSSINTTSLFFLMACNKSNVELSP